MVEEFVYYVEEDFYVEFGFIWDFIEEDVDVVIVGGGFSGMMVVVCLKECDIIDF